MKSILRREKGDPKKIIISYAGETSLCKWHAIEITFSRKNKVGTWRLHGILVERVDDEKNLAIPSYLIGSTTIHCTRITLSVMSKQTTKEEALILIKEYLEASTDDFIIEIK